MKRLLGCAVAAIVLSACTKKDTSLINASNESNDAVAAATGCNVRGYSSTVFIGSSFGNGLVKTYYPSGKVKTVKSMITHDHDHADSVLYRMVYYTSATGNLMATIYSTKKHFVGVWSGTQQTPDPNRPDEQYTITAALDPVTQRLIKIYGTNDPNYFVMQYAGNRLLKFGSIEIGYDSAGNVTWVPKRPPGGAPTSVLYQYNHSKKAAHQFYLTSGYSVHEYYNLAEACDWIPVQPVNLRIRQSMFWGNYKAGDLFFDKHIVDANGYLLSYRNALFNQTIYNAWTCRR